MTKIITTRKRAALFITAAAAILVIAILAASWISSGRTCVKGIKNNEDRVKYLLDLGWCVDEDPISQQDVIIPKVFPEIYSQYNELQLAQGFDLRRYKGCCVTVYCYSITNYSSCDDQVIASLYIYKNSVIAGDIHSTAMDGFMHALTRR